MSSGRIVRTHIRNALTFYGIGLKMGKDGVDSPSALGEVLEYGFVFPDMV